jgi:hypothetical protein
VAGGVGVEEGADWSEIGQRIESQIRGAIGGWAGASAEDDWSTIGNKMAAKVQRILDEAMPDAAPKVEDDTEEKTG